MNVIFSSYNFVLYYLTEMRTRNRKKCFWGVERSQCIKLTTLPCHHLCADCLDTVIFSTPHNPKGLHGLLQG
jgi:hypothetical protein